jgi:hypothetical protein
MRGGLLGIAVAAAALIAAPPALAKDELVLAIQGEPAQGYDPTLGWGEYGHPLIQSTLLRRDAAGSRAQLDAVGRPPDLDGRDP